MSEKDVERTPGPHHPLGPRTVGNPDLSISDHDLLVRIYERQRSENERLDSMGKDLNALNARFDALDDRYVTKVEFWPVKTIVYATVGLVLASVVSALIAMIVISREAGRLAETRGKVTSDTLAGWMP